MDPTTLTFWSAILTSRLFLTLFATYFITHTAKLITHRYETDKWEMKMYWETGGMPSSHASIVVALAVGVAFETGPSAIFIATVIFGLITIRDSFGVRASVGEQAKLLNVLSGKLNIHHKARIVLGHTPLQVTMGILVGFLVSFAMYALL